MTMLLSLKKTFSKKNNAPVNQLDAHSNSSFQHLQYLEENKSRLLIKLDNCQQIFQSMVVSVEDYGKPILLDELFPMPEIKLEKDQLIYCELHENGSTTSFSSQIIKQTQFNNLPALIIQYPDSIDQDQRRNNFRLQLDKNHPASARLTSSNHAELFGMVKDISNHGVRINIQGNRSEELRSGDILNNCQIKLDDINQFECQLTVRSKRYNNRPYRHTQIGAEITHIRLSHRNLLSHFVSRQQRMQCRHRADSLYQ